LSANTIKDEAERCRTLGMDEYLSKPMQLALLQHALERWLPPAGPDAETPRPPVDVEVLKGLVGDDPAVIGEFLMDFRAAARQGAAQIEAACRQGHASAAAEAAHKLKSSARAVGALALAQ